MRKRHDFAKPSATSAALPSGRAATRASCACRFGYGFKSSRSMFAQLTIAKA